ncbi:amidohydrolase family protein [Archangium violaceum]|uniref:amidohydrolase family protein n=1 Tax=Archangium violaceum TaxID=83451 RepID=UPI00193B719C|nr:amidohydrolase family protein [Archangium violaceum]QRK12737.1 amidohydrolase family protein [Archangium violaceum]
MKSCNNTAWKFLSEADVFSGSELLAGGVERSHAHALSGVQNAYIVDLRSPGHGVTYEEVLTTIKEHVRGKSAGDWVFFVNFAPSLLGFVPGVGLRRLGFEQLDRISTTVNIVVESASGHGAYANSTAFASVGVTAATPAPPNSSYEVDADGELTGVMLEPPSFGPFLKHKPKDMVGRAPYGSSPTVLV